MNKLLLFSFLFALGIGAAEEKLTGRFLYVATPGIRNYLEYGGHGLLVYDINAGHRFVKRIPTGGYDEAGKPRNVKGIAASPTLNRIFITTPKTMMAVDVGSEKLLWEKAYEGGCDRMAMSPDGKTLYVPSFESDHWNVVDGASGELIHQVVTRSGAHNTIFGPDGREVYLAGLKSPFLFVAGTAEHSILRKVGPFSAAIRPFTINADQTRCYVNVNDLLGFEVGDLKTGKMLASVKVSGFEKGPVKRHGCPSHGIALSPDGKEIWLTDAANSRLHIFDNSTMPPQQVESLTVRDQPGWITMSLDGMYVYPSTGEVIERKSRKVLTLLSDESGNPIQSEKMVELHLEVGKIKKAGDQFAFGRTVAKKQ